VNGDCTPWRGDRTVSAIGPDDVEVIARHEQVPPVRGPGNELTELRRDACESGPIRIHDPDVVVRPDVARGPAIRRTRVDAIVPDRSDAMRLPSGDQVGYSTHMSVGILRSLDPPGLTRYPLILELWRVELNTIVRPSGDQSGPQSSAGSFVMSLGSEPSALTT
jgi:hypothetical protein